MTNGNPLKDVLTRTEIPDIPTEITLKVTERMTPNTLINLSSTSKAVGAFLRSEKNKIFRKNINRIFQAQKRVWANTSPDDLIYGTLDIDDIFKKEKISLADFYRFKTYIEKKSIGKNQKNHSAPVNNPEDEKRIEKAFQNIDIRQLEDFLKESQKDKKLKRGKLTKTFHYVLKVINRKKSN